MDSRTLYPSQVYGLGRVFLDFSFLTNGNTSPLLSTVQGVTAGSGTAPPLPVIASITRTGAGVLVVQLSSAEKFNKVITAYVDLDDTPNDGAYATIKSVANEGSATAGIAFTITTRAGATTTATDFGTGGTGAARAVYVSLCLRNTTAGK